MNNLAVFNNEQFGEIRTIEEKGKVYFCGKDVATALCYADYGKAIRQHCKTKGRVNRPTLTNGGKQNITFVDEGNLYRLITHSKLPTAEKFESWVFDEILPTIRQTGSYNFQLTAEMKRRNLEVREMNARSRRAQILVRLANATSNDTFREVLVANAANLATGENLLPLPKLQDCTYSAEEIGKELGISANKVGRLANLHNLKTKEYGEWFADKAKTANKEVNTFRYYRKVVNILREIIAAEVVA